MNFNKRIIKELYTLYDLKQIINQIIQSRTFFKKKIERVFGIVVAVVFQSTFDLEKHANNFLNFLKIIFEINTSK